jgi:hypothetical protein
MLCHSPMMTWLGLELQMKPPSSGLDLQWGMPSNSSNMYASRSSATNELLAGKNYKFNPDSNTGNKKI